MSGVRNTCGGNNKCLKDCGCKISYKFDIQRTVHRDVFL